MEDMEWRRSEDIGALRFLDGRRYEYKGVKRNVAIEGNLSAYEFILEGLLRLQIGVDKGLIQTGVLPISAENIKEAIRTTTKKAFVDINIKAFDLGFAEAQKNTL